MSHQPFESWIIDKPALGAEEKQQLHTHLETCPQCKQLQTSWRAVHLRLSTAPKAAPVPGFTTRWQQTLARRLEEERMKQVLQVRRFFLFLVAATFISMTLLILFLTLGGSAFSQAAILAQRLSSAVEWVETAQGYLFALLHFTPPAVPLVIWIILSTIFSILALIWVVSLWRITFQGAKS